MSDIRKIMSHLQKYSLSFDTDGCSYYAEGCPKKHTDPVTHVNVDEDSFMLFARCCCTVIWHKPTEGTFCKFIF